MHDPEQARQTAQIIPFKLRSKPRAGRARSEQTVAAPVTVIGTAWYHDDAISAEHSIEPTPAAT